MTMYRWLRVALVAGLATQAACSHSSSEAVTDLPPDLKSDSYVSDIKIDELPPTAPFTLADSLTSALSEATKSCATGTHPLRLEITVTQFKTQNAAMTILVGSSNAIMGSAQLVQPDTGAKLGDYDIATSTGGGGTIAAIAMAHGERAMSKAFATELCKKAFGRDPVFR